MPLHDIFPAIDTTWYLVMFVTMTLCVALLLLWVFWRWRKRKKKKTRSYYLNQLSICDFNDSKHTANKLGYYGKFVVRTVQERETLQHLISTLSPYKYHKETLPLPTELQKEIQIFLTQIRSKDV